MQSVKVEDFDWKALFSVKGASAVAAITVMFAGSIAFAVSSSITNSERVITGVKAEGVDISGLSESGAIRYFNSLASERVKPLKFSYGDKTFSIAPTDINLVPNVQEAVDEAFNYGRGSDSIIVNMKDQIKCALNGRNVKLTAAYDENLLNEKLNAIAAQINCQPVNAYCELDSNGGVLKYAGTVNVYSLSNETANTGVVSAKAHTNGINFVNFIG